MISEKNWFLSNSKQEHKMMSYILLCLAFMILIGFIVYRMTHKPVAVKIEIQQPCDINMRMRKMGGVSPFDLTNLHHVRGLTRQ